MPAAPPLYEEALRAVERVRGDMALVYRARGELARALALRRLVREAESDIAALSASLRCR